MNLLRTVGVFIGWLTGSLAGLGAIFYTFGYLVTRAHLNMLGLYGLSEFDAEHFVREGAKFFIVVGYSVAETGLILAIPVVVICGFGLVVVLGLQRIRVVRTFFETTRLRVKRLSTNRVCRGVVYSLLVVLLVVHSDAYLEKFSEPLMVSDLLYTNINEPGLGVAINNRVTEIRTWLLKGDAKSTKGRFNDLLVGAFLAGGLLYVAVQLMSRGNLSAMLRGLLIAPFVVSFIIYLFLVPMLYGILVRPTQYPVIVIDLNSTMHIDSTLLFLLKKTDREFIVWDSRHRRVIWIPSAEVRKIEVRRIQGLFGTDEKEP